MESRSPQEDRMKRQKMTEEDVIDLTGNSDDDGDVISFEMHIVRRSEDLPVCLFENKCLPDWATRGPALGFSLSKAVSGDIQWAFVSNFMIDMLWLATACGDLLAADRLVIVHGEGDSTNIKRALNLYGVCDDHAYVFSPRCPPYGTHHSKFFLLEYKTGMRVIIYTANLVYCDVNNKSQAVFVQDFPAKLSHDEARTQPEGSIGTDVPTGARHYTKSDFEDYLIEYIQALGMDDAECQRTVETVRKYDFSMARGHLIGSVPSKPFGFTGRAFNTFGHHRLQACLENEKMFDPKFQQGPILAQTSSLGSLSEPYLRAFVGSLSAGSCTTTDDFGCTVHTTPLGRPSKPLQIIWPTVREVQNSIEGWFAGSSIPGYPDKVRRNHLMPLYRPWGGQVAGRQRAMPHMKTYLRYDDSSNEIAWMCVTSHNLSKAAWGESQQSKKYNTKMFRILSYELGILLVPSLEIAYQNSKWRGFSCTDPAGSMPADVLPARSKRMEPLVTRVRYVPWKRGEIESVKERFLVHHKAATEYHNSAEHNTSIEVTIPIPLPYEIGSSSIPYADRGHAFKVSADDDIDPSTYESCPWDTRANHGLPWVGTDSLGAPFPGRGQFYGVPQSINNWMELFTLQHDDGSTG